MTGLTAIRTMLGACAAAACVAAPARASDASVLQANVRAALHSAKSFVATVKINPGILAPGGGSIVYTVVAPNLYRQTVHDLPGADDTIIAGTKIYGNSGKGWDVQTWDMGLVTGFEGPIFDVEIVSVGPDRTENGVLEGTYVEKDPNGRTASDTRSCTYEKKTYRPIACTMSYGSIAFARYDDPSVSIPIPEHAKNLMPG